MSKDYRIPGIDYLLLVKLGYLFRSVFFQSPESNSVRCVPKTMISRASISTILASLETTTEYCLFVWQNSQDVLKSSKTLLQSRGQFVLQQLRSNRFLPGSGFKTPFCPLAAEGEFLRKVLLIPPKRDCFVHSGPALREQTFNFILFGVRLAARLPSIFNQGYSLLSLGFPKFSNLRRQS